MTSAAAKTHDAADALLEWLRSQPGRSPGTSTLPAPNGLAEAGAGDEWPNPAAALLGAAIAAPGVSHGDLAVRRSALQAAPLRLAQPDWLHHRLTISGPVDEVARFRGAAAGAGIVPWQLDLERLEEDTLHRLVEAQPGSLSLAGARILARQLRDAVEHRHALATARVGQSRACPFDLHALVPVPSAILALGADDPLADAWLWEHWGTCQALRHVALDPSTPDVATEPVPQDDTANGPAGPAAIRVSFWSADWIPWRALSQLAIDWLTLRVEVRPSYEPT